MESEKGGVPASVSIQTAENSAPVDNAMPKRRRSLLHMPTRTSSRGAKQSARADADESTRDDSDNTLRGSKSSIAKAKGRKDPDSRGSSKGSRRADQHATTTGGEPKTTKSATTRGSMEDGRPRSVKKAKLSVRLLAFLSCCSSSSASADDTSLLSPKKTKAQSSPTRLSTPEKVAAETASHSTEEQRKGPHVDAEKASSDTTSAQQQQDGQPVLHFENLQKKNSQKGAAKRQSDKALGVPDQGSLSVGEGLATGSKTEAVVVTGPLADPSSTQTHPPAADKIGPVVSEEDEALSKPLPPEGDTDDGKETDAGLTPGVHPLLSQSGTQQDSQQQWLLPPVSPHLRNRKCLILDLDETLVHSSFKVVWDSFYIYIYIYILF